MTNPKISPAVRRALAYVHIVGELPDRVQWRTRCKVYDLVERESFEKPRTVKAEALAAVEGHALVKAHKAMIAAGFELADQWVQNRYNLARGIRYFRNGERGTIYSHDSRANTFHNLEMVETLKSDRM